MTISVPGDLDIEVAEYLKHEAIGFNGFWMFTMVGGIVGNFLTIIAVSKYEYLQTPTNILLLNLAGKQFTFFPNQTLCMHVLINQMI